MRNHYTNPLRNLKLKALIIPNTGKDMEQLKISFTGSENIH